VRSIDGNRHRLLDNGGGEAGFAARRHVGVAVDARGNVGGVVLALAVFRVVRVRRLRVETGNRLDVFERLSKKK
jgi:hypothetical protein